MTLNIVLNLFGKKGIITENIVLKKTLLEFILTVTFNVHNGKTIRNYLKEFILITVIGRPKVLAQMWNVYSRNWSTSFKLAVDVIKLTFFYVIRGNNCFWFFFFFFSCRTLVKFFVFKYEWSINSIVASLLLVQLRDYVPTRWAFESNRFLPATFNRFKICTLSSCQ